VVVICQRKKVRKRKFIKIKKVRKVEKIGDWMNSINSLSRGWAGQWCMVHWRSIRTMIVICLYNIIKNRSVDLI
jgi:hypothetical protein